MPYRITLHNRGASLRGKTIIVVLTADVFQLYIKNDLRIRNGFEPVWYTIMMQYIQPILHLLRCGRDHTVEGTKQANHPSILLSRSYRTARTIYSFFCRLEHSTFLIDTPVDVRFRICPHVLIIDAHRLVRVVHTL